MKIIYAERRRGMSEEMSKEWHEHPLFNGSYHEAIWCYVWSSTNTVGEIPPEAPIQCSVCGKMKGV